MLRVVLLISSFVLIPGLSLGSNSDTSSNASSTERWIAQLDSRGAPNIKTKMDINRRKLIDSGDLRKSLRGPTGRSKKGDKDSRRKSSKSRESSASTSSSSKPTGPTNRVTSPKSKGKEKKAEKRPKNQKYNFEFSKAEIMDVVKAISNMTGKNFIIPDKLKSQRITILSPTPISAKEAYQVFLAALEINGVTIVTMGKFLKLMDSKKAIKKTIPTCVGPKDVCPQYSERMVTRLVHLSHIEVNQVSSIIKSLMGKSGALSIFQPSNALIISEYAPNLTRILKVLKALDIPGFDDELQIVQIDYATAAEIADKLTQIFDVQRQTAKKSSRSKGKKTTDTRAEDEVQISKILADERTNQLIIKANKRSFEAIKQLIAKLDVPISEAEQGRVHVYYLENAKAEELSSTLSSLAQGKSNSSTSRSKGSKSRATKSTKQSAVLFEGEVKITADKPTNALIVVSSAHDYRSLKKIIHKLDRPRRQVYVEAAILEVTTSDSEKQFLHWHTPGRFSKSDIGELGGANTLGFLQSGPFSAADSGISPTLSPAGLLGMAGGSVAGIVGKSFTIPGTEVTLPSFGVLLQWIQKDSNAQVLSTPHILTMDNEQANIEVGKKVPFQRGVSMGASSLLGAASRLGSSASGISSALGGLGGLGGFGGGFSSIDRIDVKMKLSLTPQITEHNKVRLEVEQQIEDIVGQDGSTGQPITSNRSVKSVVVMQDQQTVVLGGLMRDRITEGESKIPILGDLPLIGTFFKSKTSDVEKVNLLLVLTPYIIDRTEDFQKILERKMGEHEEFASEYYGSSRQYRAHIDYSKKTGPLARIGAAVLHEMKKLENGGDGGGTESLVQPDPSTTSPVDLEETNSSEPPPLEVEAATPSSEEAVSEEAQEEVLSDG